MKTKLNIDFRATTTSHRIRQRRAKKTLLYPLIQRGLGGFSSKFHILDRGYTGHEHLLDHGIINMNGRIYDPIVGQFMQADNYIQTPEDYIGYNRYAYCRYNPFKFTDPSGEMWRASGFKEQGMNPAASYMYNDDVECPAPVPSPNAYEKEITYTGWKNGKFTTWTVSASGSGGAGGSSGSGGNGSEGGGWLGRILRAIFGGSDPESDTETNGIGTPGGKSKEDDDKDPLPNKGKKINLPAFDDIKKTYPKDKSPGVHATPSRDNYPDQCAIRFTSTLLELGVSGSDFKRWGEITREGFMRGAKSTADWLESNYGYPEKITDVDGFQSKYHGKQGIVFFFRGPKIWNHIDYWDGYGGTGSDFYDSSRGVKQIWFWRLK